MSGRNGVAAAIVALFVVGAALTWRATSATSATDATTPSIDEPPPSDEPTTSERSARPDASVLARGGDAGTPSAAPPASGVAPGSPVDEASLDPMDLELPLEAPPETPPEPTSRPEHEETPAEAHRAQLVHSADILDLSTSHLEDRRRAAQAAGDSELASVLALRIERQRARAAALRTEAETSDGTSADGEAHERPTPEGARP